MTTASMSLSSSTRRRSWTKPGRNVATSFRRASLIRSAARFASMSQSVLISTFFSLANPRLSELPCPLIPMLAVTTRSLAPRTRAGESAQATPAAAVASRNVRRSTFVSTMRFSIFQPLEHETHAEAYRALTAGRAGNLSKRIAGRRAESRVRIPPPHRVRDVEHVNPELGGPRRLEREALDQRHVQLPEAWTFRSAIADHVALLA